MMLRTVCRWRLRVCSSVDVLLTDDDVLCSNKTSV